MSVKNYDDNYLKMKINTFQAKVYLLQHEKLQTKLSTREMQIRTEIAALEAKIDILTKIINNEF